MNALEAFRRFAADFVGSGAQMPTHTPSGDRITEISFMRAFHGFCATLDYGPKVTVDMMLGHLKIPCDVILDIGVSSGTPDLYAAYPDANYLLIDPLVGPDEPLLHAPKHYARVAKAVGAAPGRQTIFASGGHSSFHRRAALTQSGTPDAVEVEVTTLDALIDGLPPTTRVGVKVDTEGHEIAVLDGLDAARDRVAFLICEVSVLNRFEDGYSFADLIAAMDAKGFRMLTILTYQPPRMPLLFYDCLFLPKDAPEFDGERSADRASPAPQG